MEDMAQMGKGMFDKNQMDRQDGWRQLSVGSCVQALFQYHEKKAKYEEFSLTVTSEYVGEMNSVRINYPLSSEEDTYHSRIRFQIYKVTSYIIKTKFVLNGKETILGK